MIRITRMTDYGIVLLAHFARNADRAIHNAKELAVEAELPLPTVTKVHHHRQPSGLQRLEHIRRMSYS